VAGRRRLIAVCGESDPATRLQTEAFELGRGIAERGAALICGGLTGVMEHAARGAQAAGGLTIGLLPGDDPRSANPAIEIAIATGLGHGRNAVLVLSADGVVALGGGLGTLSEIALAMRLGRPAVGVSTWEYRRQGQTEPGLPMLPSVGDALDWLFGRLK
jgi:uncharacterized protein (TIGR00725 family)